MFDIVPTSVVYDLETLPNFFSCAAVDTNSDQRWYFEVSDWADDCDAFIDWIDQLRHGDCEMVGFNSIGFDYPIVHALYKMKSFSARDAYDKCCAIINGGRFDHNVWESEHVVPQIDLYKVHHFDNHAKATSLKILEFNTRADQLEEMPIEPGTVINAEQAQGMRDYNFVDVEETKRFWWKSQSEIKLRRDIGVGMNISDVKMGEKILINEMAKAGLYTYTKVGGRKVKKQTKRSKIDLSECIFPYVSFERPEFERIRSYLAGKVITETKGVFKDLTATVEGIKYKIGTGGLHGSVDRKIVRSCDKYQIVDVDVASFYPNLAIKNDLYPEHLGQAFCDAYLGVYKTRKTFPKGTSENNAYKLALNGAYGGSNNEYSPFLDAKYTMQITINGQLLLLMLVEQLIKTPGLRMIQANTDGVTYLCPREYIEHTRSICRWWEELTKLELEEAQYKIMAVRDVNNYICLGENGKVKRIGAYAHETALENPGTRELPWYKDWSSRVVAKAAQAYLLDGVEIEEFMQNHDDMYDFLLRTKVPKKSPLYVGDVKVGATVRYFISTDGGEMKKIMQAAGPVGEYKRANKLTDQYFQSVMDEIGPGVWDERIHTKNKSTYAERVTGVNTGWKVTVCNDINKFDTDKINYEWYYEQARKLIDMENF